MASLIAENPFLQGLDYAARMSERTTGVVNETNRNQAVSRMLSNLGVMQQRINQREAAAASDYYKRAREIMSEPSSTGGEDVQALEMKRMQDQQKLAIEEMGYRMAREADELTARNYVASMGWLVGQMKPGEQAMLEHLRPEMQSALDRLLSPMGGGLSGGRGGRSGTDKGYEFREINAGDMSVVGAFDPRTGRFIEQSRYMNPTAELEAAKTGAEIANIDSQIRQRELSTQKTVRDMLDPTVVDAGNTRHVEKRLRPPAKWNEMSEEDRGTWVEEQKASLLMPKAQVRYDEATGDFVFAQVFDDLRPAASGGARADKEEKARLQLKQKLSIQDEKVRNQEQIYRNNPTEANRKALQDAKKTRDGYAMESNAKYGTNHPTGTSTTPWLSEEQKREATDAAWRQLPESKRSQFKSREDFRIRLWKAKGWMK